jgi:hypothetical protein
VSQQINLFNPIFLKQKKHFSATAMAQALGLIVVGMILMAVYSEYRLAQLNKDAVENGKRLALAQEQMNKLKGTAARQKSKALEDELQRAEVELKSLQQVFDTLQKGDFGNTKGYSEYMHAFSRQIIDGLWLTGFTLQGAGAGIGLRGRALQPELVPAYIGRLKREPVMQGKSFSMLEIQTPQVEQAANNNQPAKRTPAAYVEFTLQSSTAREAMAGEKTR